MTRQWGRWVLERLDIQRRFLPSFSLKEPELVGAAILGIFIVLFNIIRLVVD